MSIGAAANVLKDVAARFGADVLHEAYSSMGQGGANQQPKVVREAQERTPYEGKRYVKEQLEVGEAKEQQDNDRSIDSFYRTERANDRRRYANTQQELAIADQGNRANAALGILEGYNQARRANQDFLANINSNSMSQK